MTSLKPAQRQAPESRPRSGAFTPLRRSDLRPKRIAMVTSWLQFLPFPRVHGVAKPLTPMHGGFFSEDALNYGGHSHALTCTGSALQRQRESPVRNDGFGGLNPS